MAISFSDLERLQSALETTLATGACSPNGVWPAATLRAVTHLVDAPAGSLVVGAGSGTHMARLGLPTPCAALTGSEPAPADSAAAAGSSRAGNPSSWSIQPGFEGLPREALHWLAGHGFQGGIAVVVRTDRTRAELRLLYRRTPPTLDGREYLLLRALIPALRTGLGAFLGVAAEWPTSVRPAGLLPPAADSPLTPREREVATLLAEGLSNRVLAARLGIREATARHHVEHVLRKLEVSSRGLAAAKFRGMGAA